MIRNSHFHLTSVYLTPYFSKICYAQFYGTFNNEILNVKKLTTTVNNYNLNDVKGGIFILFVLK